VPSAWAGSAHVAPSKVDHVANLNSRMPRSVRTAGLALGDPLQWLIIGGVVVVVTVIAVYLLFRIIQTLAKADRYFTTKQATLGLRDNFRVGLWFNLVSAGMSWRLRLIFACVTHVGTDDRFLTPVRDQPIR